MANFDVARDLIDLIDNDTSVFARDSLKIFNPQEYNIAGWCAAPTMHLINYFVSNCLEDNEQYLEIGTYCGKSVIAALNNNNKLANVIDPFDLFLPDGKFIKSEWDKNIDKFAIRDCITLYKQFCDKFDGSLPTIGIFYYDGNHDSGHTYEGLKKYEKYLSNQTIIIVDDYYIREGGKQPYAYPGYDIVKNPVEVDTNRWINECKYATLVCCTKWINGQAIIFYDRNM